MNVHDPARFSPFTYSIGLETTLAAAAEALQEYPLAQPVDEATFRTFMQSLTFVHEATHVAQYVSTAYGLRTLRYTLILLNALSKKPGWELPVLETLMEQGGKFTPDEVRVVDASLLFLDGIDQMRLHYKKHDGGWRVAAWSEPWSPHFFMGGGTDPESREKRVAELKSIGAHVRTLPHVVVGDADLVVNVAALMETYALLAEWNHIHNALTTDAKRGMDALPPRPEYRALFDYALVQGVAPPAVLMPAMAAIIDASLMYDPFVLYDVPWDVPGEDGRADRYPGETFLELCEAAKHVDPIRGIDDVGRFHREICKRAGLPEPQWMAETALATAQRVMDKTPGEEMLLRKALTAHRDALKLRCERGSEQFAFMLPTTGMIDEVLHVAMPTISFFNVHTLEPDGFDPRKVDAASMHPILFQAVVHPRIECPLKLGNPFYCSSAGKDPDTLCVWTHKFGRSECWVDLLEKDCGLVEGEA